MLIICKRSAVLHVIQIDLVSRPSFTVGELACQREHIRRFGVRVCDPKMALTCIHHQYVYSGSSCSSRLVSFSVSRQSLGLCTEWFDDRVPACLASNPSPMSLFTQQSDAVAGGVLR